MLPFFVVYTVTNHPSTYDTICRCMSTYDGCSSAPLVTASVRDSELIIHFQEAYAKFFQFAITSRISSQTGLPRNQSTEELFA